MVSTLRWYDGGPHDKRQWLMPDLPAPSLAADWLAGRDAALEAALTHQAAAPDQFTERSRYFERASQQTAWRPFWA